MTEETINIEKIKKSIQNRKLQIDSPLFQNALSNGSLLRRTSKKLCLAGRLSKKYPEDKYGPKLPDLW